jgi:hypothetical protein
MRQRKIGVVLLNPDFVSDKINMNDTPMNALPRSLTLTATPEALFDRLCALDDAAVKQVAFLPPTDGDTEFAREGQLSLCCLEYNTKFLGRSFWLEIQALEANNFALSIFDQNKTVAYFFAHLFMFRIIPVHREGFSGWIMNDFYVGHITSPSLILSHG